MRKQWVKMCAGLFALSILAASVGCYESIFRLSPVADAKVDRALCGNWTLRSSQDQAVLLAVRNLDDHLYSVEWRNVGENKSLYLVADSTVIGGVCFVHARNLPEDGSLADSHLLMRVDVEGNRMLLRNLSDEFMKQKQVDSDSALRGVIEANLDNNDLYDVDAFTGDRVPE